jgi:hypothetical protein
MKKHLVIDKILQRCMFIEPKTFYKEWHVVLGLRLVLMTLHGRMTIDIEQDK